jgi:hypothetical protein
MTPSERLVDKLDEMRRGGLLDIKLHYVGPRDGSVSVDTLAEEVLAIIECCEQRHFVDITDSIDTL